MAYLPLRRFRQIYPTVPSCLFPTSIYPLLSLCPGQGDFISLSVNGGFVEFRFDLGSDAVVVRSSKKVELKRFQRLVAKLHNQIGTLQLQRQDGSVYDEERASSDKMLTVLDLQVEK